ncbi:macrophage colony-stimulating factor 1 [Tiliqua scincoides]|uniref:macrophage colony-stimulating factor 1 n=1 Tax=Tiliqua scincoides TaxID=71010 RepID=UPI003461D762
MICSVLLALLLLATCSIHGTELRKDGCRRIISDVHIKNLSELIDSQMKSSCLLSFDYVDEKQLKDPVCFLKAAYTPLGNILKHKMKFKRNTPNFNKLEQLKHIYDKLERDGCIIPEDEEEMKNCIKTRNATAEEMLQLVLNYFNLTQKELSRSSDFDKDCSHVFQACSDQQGQETSTLGVVTAQNCKCPDTNPISGGPSASLLPTFEPLSSIADQLDSKDTAASSLQIATLLGPTQSQGSPEGSTKPRVPRSTHKGPRTADSLDFRSGIDVMSSSPEELALADVLQGPDPVAMNTASPLASTITPSMWSSKVKSLPPFPSNQQHFEFMEMESPLPGSGAVSSQTHLSELSSRYPFSGLAKSSPPNQWLQTREVDMAIPGATSNYVSDTSSTSSLNRASLANLEPVDSSRVPSGGKPVTLPPSALALFPDLDPKESVSAVQHPSPRLVVATESSSSPRQRATESYSWGEWGSGGRAPGMQHSTQVRERRAGQEEGLSKDREPEDSMPGPNFDLSFIPPNADQYRENPEPRDIQGKAAIYVPVASVLGVLLAVGGLLFYLHRTRALARRRLQRTEYINRQEGRPLNRGEEHVELQIQDEL